jgi:hypothetical protein
MARYFWRDGKFVDRNGEAMPLPKRTTLCRPYVISDIPGYLSPIDGRAITSRTHRRDDLKRNGCVEYEPSLSPTKGKFSNPKFCKKHGLPLAEEFRT